MDADVSGAQVHGKLHTLDEDAIISALVPMFGTCNKKQDLQFEEDGFDVQIYQSGYEWGPQRDGATYMAGIELDTLPAVVGLASAVANRIVRAPRHLARRLAHRAEVRAVRVIYSTGGTPRRRLDRA